jgi:AraC family transcriptional regulator, regulatory protein of adaptative response / methylated-DNA-[protein]-cysteine methyltransferase
VRFAFHPSPFGNALVMATERGLAGLAFADPGAEEATLSEMKARWPKASYVADAARTAPIARRIFDPTLWQAEQPLRVVLIGTDWDTYSGIAGKVCSPAAARAVGAAVGKNPLAFVVPCHRVIGKAGELTGYHWGLTRKRAMLGWEAGKMPAAA